MLIDKLQGLLSRLELSKLVRLFCDHFKNLDTVFENVQTNLV